MLFKEPCMQGAVLCWGRNLLSVQHPPYILGKFYLFFRSVKCLKCTMTLIFSRNLKYKLNKSDRNPHFGFGFSKRRWSNIIRPHTDSHPTGFQIVILSSWNSFSLNSFTQNHFVIRWDNLLIIFMLVIWQSNLSIVQMWWFGLAFCDSCINLSNLLPLKFSFLFLPIPFLVLNSLP